MEIAELEGLANGEDLGRMERIERASFAQPWTIADFRMLAADERALNIGLWRGGDIVGYSIGYIAETGFHLASIAIDPQYRRQGWGSFLLAESLRKATERRCQSCYLEVRRSNSTAISLYKKFGFQLTEIRPRFYTSPVEDALVLHRILADFESDPSLAVEMPYRRA